MMLIFDEASGIPDGIWSVGAGFFTENILDRYWFAFSNPRRNQGYFFECFNAKRDFWHGRQIDARGVEDTDKAVYEQIIAEYGEDSSQARIEVYGEFPSAGEDQFISRHSLRTLSNVRDIRIRLRLLLSGSTRRVGVQTAPLSSCVKVATLFRLSDIREKIRCLSSVESSTPSKNSSQ